MILSPSALVVAPEVLSGLDDAPDSRCKGRMLSREYFPTLLCWDLEWEGEGFLNIRLETHLVGDFVGDVAGAEVAVFGAPSPFCEGGGAAFDLTGELVGGAGPFGGAAVGGDCERKGGDLEREGGGVGLWLLGVFSSGVRLLA